MWTCMLVLGLACMTNFFCAWLGTRSPRLPYTTVMLLEMLGPALMFLACVVSVFVANGFVLPMG